MDDLYTTLGITKTATSEEIKKAYRNMAFKYHPDRNPGDKVAEEQFKKVNEAYSVLGDETKRKQYDMYSSNPYQNQYQNYQNSNQNSYQNTYSSYSYQSNPFWNFYEYSDGNDNQYQNTYTYTNYNTNMNPRQYGWNKLLRGFSTSLFSLIGVWLLRFVFPLNIFCILGLVRGISQIAGSFRYLIPARKQKKAKK